MNRALAKIMRPMKRSEYNAIDALNYSSIKHILTSPACFKDRRENPEPEDESKYLVGTLAHAMVLEGKDLRDMYAIKPKSMSFATKEGKAWRDAQVLPILKEDDADKVPRMAEAIANDPDASQAIKSCPMREHVAQGTLHGLHWKAMFDGLGQDATRWGITDIKTCIDASPRGFAKRVRDFHYDLQQELYTQLLANDKSLGERPWWLWIAVESKAPFEVAVYWPDETILEAGRRKLDRAVALYRECTASGIWPKALAGARELTAAPFTLENIEEKQS